MNQPAAIREVAPPEALRPATVAARAGISTDPSYGAVAPPLHLSATFQFEALGRPRSYDYTRSGNPTRDLFGQAVADLEGGARGCVTASGMAAISATLFALLPPQGRVLVPVDCYGGSWRLFEALHSSGRIGSLTYADLSDPAQAASAIADGVDLVWLETPSNPLLRISDLAAISASAHAHQALVAVDNTFASPVLQRPLALGADVVVHSATKYLNGHSDVVAGVVVTADSERGDQIAWWANTLGLTGSPFDAYLALRGLHTLPVRMAAAQRNATAIADLLATHPTVTAVHYPGLADHPHHNLAAAQMDGPGAIVSFQLADSAAVAEFVHGLRCFCLAESLGGIESLVCHPATMTHAAMSPDARELAGITDGLVRLSLGIEDTADLIADVTAGLARADRLA